MKKIAFLSLALFLLSGCAAFNGGSYGDKDMMTSSYGMDEMEASMSMDSFATAQSANGRSIGFMPPSSEGPVEGVEQKIIKSGSLALHMESVQEGVEQIKIKVSEWGGDTISSNISRYENSYYGEVTVRVPSEAFDAAMAGLKELALYVDSEYTNADNITEMYMDLEARLTNLKEEEQQYLSILDRAVTVEEILNVTDYLSQVRYEIESAEGQLKYYDTNVDYSTITLSLTEDESVEVAKESWRPIGTVHEATSQWVVFLQTVLDAAIYLVIFGWPVLVILLLVRAWKRKQRKTTKK
ncbi:DUF4349 domain-containing protein [Candidatus Peregrinibacteria bacterium]|nr:MAG: DUF4349 domain-containing protein [Candidatus Peregrinibacteria bacterium]